MRRWRPGTCGEPGPYDTHCTEDPGHRWSCYDAGADASWNDWSPEGWQEATPHRCGDPTCPDTPVTRSGDPECGAEGCREVNGAGVRECWRCVPDGPTEGDG